MNDQNIQKQLQEEHKELNKPFQPFVDQEGQKPGGLKGPQAGVVYQQAVTNAVALNTYSHYGNKFVLLSEDQRFAKFDDLVLNVGDDILFLQMKHSKEMKSYSPKDFIQGANKKVNLADYFEPYCKIKKRCEGKNIFFIFFFNSGFDQELEDCTKEIKFSHDEKVFEGFEGHTRKFNFDGDKSKEIKENIIQEINSRLKVEIHLIDFENDDEVQQFISILQKEFQNRIREFKKNPNKTFKPIVATTLTKSIPSVKPLFLGLLNLSEVNPKSSLQDLRFTEDFIQNTNITGVSKKIREGLRFEASEEEIFKAILRATTVDCPKDLVEFMTVEKDSKLQSKSQKTSDSQVQSSSDQKETETNSPKIQTSFEIRKNQFLLVSLFSNDIKGNLLTFQNGYESNLQQTIYEKCRKESRKSKKSEKSEKVEKSKKSEKTENLVNKENLEKGDEPQEIELSKSPFDDFLENLYFKIQQPTHKKLEEIAKNKIKTLTERGSKEIFYQISAFTGDWLFLSELTTMNGHDFHQRIQQNIKNMAKYDLLLETNEFLKKYSNLFSIFQDQTLSQESLLDNFVKSSETESMIMVISEKSKGASNLYAYRAIKRIPRIQEEDWAFVNLDQDNFWSLDTYLESETLQYVILDISNNLSENHCQKLKKIFEMGTQSKKRIFILNTIHEEDQVENLKAIKNCSPFKIEEFEAKRLDNSQIESLCQPYQEKYLLVSGRPYQLKNIIRNKNCGIWKAMSHPEYLEKILKECGEMKQENSDHTNFYIPQEINLEVPIYKLETVLKETSAKIIWLKNSNLGILKKMKGLLEEYFKEEVFTGEMPLNDQTERPGFDAIEKISSQEKYEESLKNKKTLVLEIREQVHKDNEKEILVLHYVGDNSSQEDHLVESERQNAFIKAIKPIYFSENSQIYGNQSVSLDDLLTRPSDDICGTLHWIQGGAGMGKTFLSDELERKWKKDQAKDSYEWVFKLNLTKIDENEITENTKLEDFLARTKPEKENWMNLALQHDKERVGGILLELDAWDEVKPEKHESVKKLFSMIPSTVSAIIMSRPYGIGSIELDKWYNNYLTLKPFHENGIQEFVTSFFSKQKNLYGFSEENEERWRELGEEIIEWIEELGTSSSQMMGIPLQISQLCQILLPKIQNLSQTKEGSEQDISAWFRKNKPVDISSLYEQFIKTGFQKSFPVDSEDPGVLYDHWWRYLNFLSIQAYHQLFGKPSEFLKDYHQHDLLLSSESIRFLLKTGLVRKLNDDKEEQVEFTHQTYKEYFGALYILKSFFLKKQSKIYEEVLKDIQNSKYMKYHRIVFVFAFQISLTYHPIFPPFSESKEFLVNELWKALRENTNDVLGRASLELFATCFSPLTGEQIEELYSLLPESYQREIVYISSNIKSLLTKQLNQKNVDLQKGSPTNNENFSHKDTKNELTEEVILSSLKKKDEVVEFTQSFLQKNPGNKKLLAMHFKKILGTNFQGETLNKYWDIDGGFSAMAMLGNHFDQDHASYFKHRIKRDPEWRVSHATQALSSLLKTCSQKNTLKALTSILLAIFNQSGVKLSEDLEAFLQNTDPLEMMESLCHILQSHRDLLSRFAEKTYKSFEDLQQDANDISSQIHSTIALILWIAYIAKYAIILDEELLVITGEKCVSLLEASLYRKWEKNILEFFEGYDYFTDNHTHFVKKGGYYDFVTPEEILHQLPKEKLVNFGKLCFSNNQVSKMVDFLRSENLFDESWANELEKAARKHWHGGDYWAVNGGLIAICNSAKYFNGEFCLFFVLRVYFWNDNKIIIEENIHILDQDLMRAETDYPHHPQVISARHWYRRFRKSLEMDSWKNRFDQWFKNQWKNVKRDTDLGAFFDQMAQDFKTSIANELD